MSKEAEREALAASFKDMFSTLGVAHIAWPNKPFETPADSTFVEFNIVDRGVTRHGLGRNFFRRNHGTVQVDIYVPQDEGTKVSREFADIMANFYEMYELPTSDGELIKFETPFSHALATNRIRAANLGDNWDRYVFEAPFHRDQHVEK